MKTRLVILFFLLANICFAQFQTDLGSKYVGGNFSFNSTKMNHITQSSKTNSYTLAPYFGYFPKDNTAIGIQFFFTNSKTDNAAINNGNVVGTDLTHQNITGISPFIRQYVPIGPKFLFFSQLNAYSGFGTAKTTSLSGTTSQNTELDISQFGASISPGFTYFASKKIALEFSFNLINYNKYRFKSGDIEIQTNDSFSFKFGEFTPAMGASFYF